MKTILLTGATGGIGNAIANKLLNQDAEIRLFGFGRRDSDIHHENYHHLICDLADPNATENITKQLIREVNCIDTVILSAGFGKFSELEQFSLDQMQEIMNVNFLSQAILLKTVLPLLKKTNNSKIIAIGSESALNGARKGSMYCAAKFALRGFLQSLRTECNQSSTTVTLINPGFVKTDFFDKLNFEPGLDIENSINAEQIAKTIGFILQMENNCVLEEINLQPMKKVIKRK